MSADTRGDRLSNIERKAVEVLARGEWPDQSNFGTWRAECMVAWLKDAGIALVPTDDQGAVEDRAVLRQMVEDIANQITEEGMTGWAENIRDEMRRLGVGQ